MSLFLKKISMLTKNLYIKLVKVIFLKKQENGKNKDINRYRGNPTER